MAEPYVYSKFKLSAVVSASGGAIVFDDIVAMSSTFGLNGIPTAALTVAVGYDARSNKTKKATIHDAKDKMRPRDKVVVTLTIETTAGRTEKMENDTFVVFDGFLAGTGYQRSTNGANYTLHLIHWLDALQNSSALNGNWFPNAPYAMTTNASFYALNYGEGNVEGVSVPLAIDSAGDIITPSNAATDLWGSVIKPLFKKIAKYPLPNDGDNTAALAALDRMPGRGASVNTPLALNLGELLTLNMQESLRMALTKESLESFAYTSFWGKIIGEYAPQFFFAISPGVEHALAIPLFGGLRWEEGKTKEIFADEYSQANLNAHMNQLLETVMVFWPMANDPMASTGAETGGSDLWAGPLASYPETRLSGPDKPGLRLFKEPPSWLANLPAWYGGSGPTTSVKGRAAGDCLAPGKGENNPPPEWHTPIEASRELQNSEICTRFAEHWYKSEILNQRFGEVSGKLRFDIAPGSTVRIETPTAEFGTGLSDAYMIGTVVQVSFVINAERSMAGTSFVLSNLRTMAEDADEKLTKEYPPLYKKEAAWHGGPLRTPAAP